MRGILAWLTDRRIAAFQNDLVMKHYDEVRNIYGQMRGWRHDYHNHIQAMKAYMALGRTDELSAYLDELDADLDSVDTILKSGSLMLDAILNSKLSLASAKQIRISAAASAPVAMAISDVDICVVVGNLLDNAIEACEKLADPSARFIRVYIGVFKGQFYISVTNSTATGAKKPGGYYQTTKTGAYHGFGLRRVDRVVEKYGGYVNRQSEEGVFATEIMIPL